MSYISLKEALIQNYYKHFDVVTIDQVGTAVYYQWMGLMHAFHVAAEKIDKWLDINKEWDSVDDVLKLEEFQEVYSVLKGIVDLIGEVSGELLVHGRDFLLFPLAAYWQAKRTEKESIKAKSQFDSFREICETSLARRVVVQDLIGSQILEDEITEQKLIRRYRQRRYRQKVRRTEAQNRECMSESNLQSIDFTTFVVLCSIFKCEKAHHIETIRALIEILLPDGNTCTEEISAGYCKDCNKYFILEQDYKTVREKGVLLCQMINEKSYRQNQSIESAFSDLKPESILHQCGYNVNAVENLTTDQRQGILRRVIDNDLYTINSVLGFLNWLIDCNKSSGKRDMTTAIAKWQIDRDFVAKYQEELHRRVKVDRIKVRN